MPAPGGSAPGGSAPGGAWWRPPRTATAEGGTHPTGMHSCLCEICKKFFQQKLHLFSQILVSSEIYLCLLLKSTKFQV